VSSSETAYANLSFTDELAPLGSANETASAGRGRFVTLTGIAGSGVTTGSITGTVTDPNGAGLGNVCVFFVDPASGTVAGPEAITAPDGTYSIDSLTPGTYFVYFFYGCDGPYTQNYAPQIYDGAEILEYATPVVVVRGPTYNVDAQLTAGAEITGHVADSNGRPLANVEVDAFPTWNVPEVGIGTFTNSNGDFELLGPRHRRLRDSLHELPVLQQLRDAVVRRRRFRCERNLGQHDCRTTGRIGHRRHLHRHDLGGRRRWWRRRGRGRHAAESTGDAAHRRLRRDRYLSRGERGVLPQFGIGRRRRPGSLRSLL
jgi:hypothetical protein